MLHCYGIQLPFLDLFIRLNSSVIPDYSSMFNTFEVCSLRIYEGMCILTIDVFLKGNDGYTGVFDMYSEGALSWDTLLNF